MSKTKLEHLAAIAAARHSVLQDPSLPTPSSPPPPTANDHELDQQQVLANHYRTQLQQHQLLHTTANNNDSIQYRRQQQQQQLLQQQQQQDLHLNRSEYELYRLLERANLLNYFGVFLNFGGDDVQQLYDADEEEFLEIMSLVGMTQKPLHVRRLQKALVEWKESRDMEISMLRTSHINYLMSQSAALPTAAKSQAQLPLPPPPPSSRCDKTLSTNTDSSSVPPAPLHRNTNSTCRPQSTNPTESNQYISPARIVGAPKRIRLLDSLNNRQCIEFNHNKATYPNQSPFKKRFGSAISTSTKRHGEIRSDEDDYSEEDGEIEVIDNSDSEQSDRGKHGNKVSEPSIPTKANDIDLPITDADININSTKDTDDSCGLKKSAPSPTTIPGQTEPSNQ